MNRTYAAISTAIFTASMVLTAGSGSAWAATPAPVFGTGQGLSPGDRDSRWKVVKGPAGFVPPDSQTIPYDSYVGNAYVQPITIDGTTYNPISISSDGAVDPISQNWIFAQDFAVPTAGDYLFSFKASADNSMRIIVNGIIDESKPAMPTIIGGTQVGPEIPDFNSFFDAYRTIYLDAGHHTLYAVLNDYGTSTGFTIANSPAPVPAPLPIFGAAAAFGASRRLKRRIRLAHLSVSTKAG